MRIFRIVTIVLLLFVGLTSFAQDSLRLEKVVMVSRHGLRAPLQKYFDSLSIISDSNKLDSNGWNIWKKVGVNGGELTPKGIELENSFGKYFRLWFESVGFQFHVDETYFGASSKQRTVATTHSFAAGLMPQEMVPVHYRHSDEGGFGFSDVNYLPILYNEGLKEGIVFYIDSFQMEARKVVDLLKQLPSYGLLEDVLKYNCSRRALKKGFGHFSNDTNDIKVSFDFYKFDDKTKCMKRCEPIMCGDLNVANMASDALILMYYEFPDSLRTFFKRDFSFDDMCKIAHVKDQYGRILFTAPIVAVNVSHCMLRNIYAEMNCNWHKFTFLCTHDSMIQSLLTALRVEDYKLDSTIEKDTPIGVKLLLEEWVDPNRCERYIKARLLYQSTEQIQKMQVLDLEHRPQSCTLSFTGLEKVIYEGDTLYRYDDFMNHIEKTLEAYKRTAVGKHPWK